MKDYEMKEIALNANCIIINPRPGGAIYPFPNPPIKLPIGPIR